MNVKIDGLDLGGWTLERDKNKKLFLKSAEGLGVIYNKGNAFQGRLRELVPVEVGEPVVESVQEEEFEIEAVPVRETAREQGSGLGRFFDGLFS